MEMARGRLTRSGRQVATMCSLAGVLLLLGVVFPAGAQAAPGDLDLTFSGDGKQRTDFGFGSSRAAATVRQPDGKIVAVGSTADDFALARYNPNGSLDTSFSGNGKQTTDFFGSDEGNGVALQGDGKIVVVGGTVDGDFALARYNPNGSLDTSFSGDGKQTTDFGGFGDEATGVALQGNGRIVVAGSTGDGDFALARYNPNGSPDSSFHGDGRRTTDFGGSEGANGVVVQGAGKIVAVGSTVDDFALARYNPNGSLDTSFSGDGRQTTDFGADFEGANGVALQAAGKVVAVGFAGGNFALARYNPNGSLDTTFSGDGRQTTTFGGPDQASGVALQGDGKIVAVGGDPSAPSGFGAGDFALARYNPNGSLDTSFSGDGKQRTDFGLDDGARAVALQGDGKIVAVGFTASAPLGNFALARYNPSGTLDTSFSGDGRQTTDFGGFDEGATGVAIQANGRIVVVGSDGDNFALARYNPNGSLDTSFSGDGRQTTDFGDSDQANGVALRAGKIVAVGRTGAGDNFALARYNPNGSLDSSFSGDGRQTTDFGGFEQASGVALRPSGKIVAVGGTGAGGNFALARYNLNGSLDSSFSGDGRQTTNFGGFDAARGVALQANGKFVAVGSADIGSSSNFALARYNPNGSLDASFSADGRQTTDFGGDFDAANGVALQTNGRIVVVGGGLGTDGTIDFALARYLGG
jgi:uncharacterized delta-60 repeat protein